MKLFDDFEAVKFPEENIIFITCQSYLYFIYNPKYAEHKRWKKHKNAGNDRITVCHYQEVSKEEITEAMGGFFPHKKTDFMRLCDPSELCMDDLADLLEADFPRYMSDGKIRRPACDFLYQAVVRNKTYKPYSFLRKLFTEAASCNASKEQVLIQLKDLALSVFGRDIFKEEIEIVDGVDGSSYFLITPVRVIDPADTNDWASVAEMRSVRISIEEDDVSHYLWPFLDKHFDDSLEANRNRIKFFWTDDDGSEQIETVQGFEWYLTHNFYTFESIKTIIKEIRETMDALSSGKDNVLKEVVPDTGQVVDFYRRFIYRMEYMMTVGEENGYDLISFFGP